MAWELVLTPLGNASWVALAFLHHTEIYSPYQSDSEMPAPRLEASCHLTLLQGQQFLSAATQWLPWPGHAAMVLLLQTHQQGKTLENQ